MIHSMSRTFNNIGWYNQPVFGLAGDAPNGLVGERLREALEASTWDSQKDDSQDKKHPIFRETGTKNWRDLEETSRFVCIDTDRCLVKILPSRWATPAEGGRGFVHLPENTIEVAWTCPDAELGSALRRGFQASQSKTGR